MSPLSLACRQHLGFIMPFGFIGIVLGIVLGMAGILPPDLGLGFAFAISGSSSTFCAVTGVNDVTARCAGHYDKIGR